MLSNDLYLQLTNDEVRAKMSLRNNRHVTLKAKPYAHAYVTNS
jgi:hypothetical protein